jgi:hypothetical protein
MDGANVRMVKSGSSLRLLDEAFASFRVSSQVGTEELQSYRPLEPRIFGFIDEAHAVTAYSPDNEELT